MWSNKIKSFLSHLGIQHPIIQGPMSGGITSPELVAAVSNSGALGSLGAGYMPPGEISNTIRQIKKLTKKVFSVNLFVPQEYVIDESKIEASKAALAPYYLELGLTLDKLSVRGPEDFDAQLEAVLEENVPIVSFTFGIPHPKTMQLLKAKNIKILGTATTTQEALLLENAGVDIIVAQGCEAGGHRASFSVPAQQALIGTMALVPQIVDQVKVPVVAAGGIMDARGLTASLNLGAVAAQMGTAFLVCHESSAYPCHKEAILKASEDELTLSSAFSGKLARCIRNRFASEMENHSNMIPDYPIQHYLTQAMRQAAGKRGKTELINLWAGQGAHLAKAMPAEVLINKIINNAKLIQIFKSN